MRTNDDKCPRLKTEKAEVLQKAKAGNVSFFVLLCFALFCFVVWFVLVCFGVFCFVCFSILGFVLFCLFVCLFACLVFDTIYVFGIISYVTISFLQFLFLKQLSEFL